MIRKIVYLGGLVVFIGVVWLYKTNDPRGGNFPKCPFKWATGFQCPGCGSQRAAHHLLNGRLGEAFLVNALFVIALPYIALGFFFERYERASPAWRKRLFGPFASKVVLVTVLLFWVIRNFPHL